MNRSAVSAVAAFRDLAIMPRSLLKRGAQGEWASARPNLLPNLARTFSALAGAAATGTAGPPASFRGLALPPQGGGRPPPPPPPAATAHTHSRAPRAPPPA